MKKKLFAAALLLLLLSIVGYGTYAYTTVEGTATNVITSGGVSIALVEVRDNGEKFPEAGVHGVVPGTTESKIVSVVNDGHDPAWIRVKVDVEIDLAGAGTPDTSLVTMNYNTTDWEYRDGYWYYLKSVAPTVETAKLFTQVTFAPEMDNTYQGSVARVIVSAYATQVAHNGATVWEAKGWPAENVEEVN